MISPSTLDIIKNPLEFFIMDQFEYEGSWWLPENPVYKISGTLKFHPIEGAYLELIGAFKKFIDFKTLLEPKIILGNTSDGIITLYDCFENRSSFAGLFTSSFYVNVIFKGHHFEKEEDIIFNNLSINYSHLEEWTKISGFIIYPDTDESHRTKNVDVFYTYPQKVEAKLENLNISLDYDFSLNMKGIEEYHLKQITFIKMEPDKPIHYNEFQNNICCHIQNFLSLAMGKAIYPLIIKGENASCKKESPDGSVKFKKISIFYSMNRLPDWSKQINRKEMFFQFEDISDNFEKYLNNWMKKSEILKPVYGLYFGTLYNPTMYHEHKFLSLIQAIESYHRRVHDGKYVSEDEYAKIYEQLINAIPDLSNKDLKESLIQAIESYDRGVYDGKYVSEDEYAKIYEQLINAIPDLSNKDLKESLIQAIESYHRGVYDGKYVSEDEYAKIYERLINAIPDLSNKDLKESLKKRMQYGNAVSYTHLR